MKIKWTYTFIFFIVALSLYSQTSSFNINHLKSVESIKNSNFEFAIIGDRTGEGKDPWTVFDTSVESINNRNPQFVVMIGDLIQAGARGSIALEARWQEAMTHIEKLKAPFYIIPGNHDIWNKTTYDVWNDKVGQTYFKCVCGNSLFLFLNTEEYRSGNGHGLGSDQMAFIKSSLETSTTNGPIFIFMHRPPWLEKGILKNQWVEIEELLEGKRFNLITGHLHVLGEKVNNGNRYLIVGPTGGKMRLARNPSLGMIQHYTWVKVDSDTSTLQFIENETIYPEKAAVDAYARGVRTLRYLMSQ